MHNKFWKRALHARQSESREWSNDNELHKLQQCKFKDDCKWRWHVARKQWCEVATFTQRWRENSWHYQSTNKDINVRERDEQRLLVKRNNIEADVLSSTQFRRKTSYNSECIHHEEHVEIEDISSTAKQAVTNAEKYASLIENHVMSKRDKRRIINEKATSQRRIIIALQEMRNHDKDSKQRRNKEDAEEDYWTDSLKNSRHVNKSTKSDHISLQAEKQRHLSSCNQLRCMSKSEKDLRMSKRNYELNAHITMNLHNVNTWDAHYNWHEQSEESH